MLRQTIHDTAQKTTQKQLLSIELLSLGLLGLSLITFSQLSLAQEARFSSSSFLWGVATAHFQVEGSPADSDWKRWTHQPGKIKDGTNADIACDFWNRYDQDFALSESIGLNSFRVSIAWERLEPKPGVYDLKALEHYKKIILSMRAHGLEPVVTLHHYVIPGWLADRGGILNYDFPTRFASFAEWAVRNLSASPMNVRWWITLNEPEVLTLGSFVSGVWPPGIQDLSWARKVERSLAKAHIEAVRSIRSLKIPDLKIGIAKNWPVIEPSDRGSLIDRSLAQLGDEWINHQFIRAIQTGVMQFGPSLPGHRPEKVPVPENGTLDFLGLNYYQRFRVKPDRNAPYVHLGPGPGEVSDLGWEVYSAGFSQVIEDAYKLTHLPILITENGIADRDDHLRSKFLHSHLGELKKVLDQGTVPLLGYLHWSLVDNFEWAEGMGAKFGLVAVDPLTQERKPRPSFQEYGSIIRNWESR